MRQHQRTWVLPHDVLAWIKEKAEKAGVKQPEMLRRILIKAMAEDEK